MANFLFVRERPQNNTKSLKMSSFLKRWNENIEKTRTDLLSSAYGFNTSQNFNKGWWSRNYLKVFLYSFFGIALITCYLCGFMWPFRIIAVMLLIMVGRFLWKAIKKAWTWLKILYLGRKLLKRVSGLKRE